MHNVFVTISCTWKLQKVMILANNHIWRDPARSIHLQMTWMFLALIDAYNNCLPRSYEQSIMNIACGAKFQNSNLLQISINFHTRNINVILNGTPPLFCPILYLQYSLKSLWIGWKLIAIHHGEKCQSLALLDPKFCLSHFWHFFMQDHKLVVKLEKLHFCIIRHALSIYGFLKYVCKIEIRSIFMTIHPFKVEEK